jgi:hypothetical protein
MASRVRRNRRKEKEHTQMDYSLKPGPSIPHPLKARSKHAPFIFCADGQTLTQDCVPSSSPVKSMPPRTSVAGDFNDKFDSYVDEGMDVFFDSDMAMDIEEVSRHRRKRAIQDVRWENDVIPAIIEPFMKYQMRRGSADATVAQTVLHCTCLTQGQSLDIEVVSFTRTYDFDPLDHTLLMPIIEIHTMKLRICECTPNVATQLIDQGLFPCAPIRPSLAVNIEMLEFVAQLFLNLPPNNTAWCSALEDFLLDRKFRLKDIVSLFLRLYMHPD